MTTQSMNHQQALETMAAERYLLREMTDEERSAFEAHYLECAECLEAVTFGADFLETGREVALEQQHARESAPVPTWRERLLPVFSGWLRPAPALAFALLVCLAAIGYQATMIHQQQTTIAELKAPRQEFRYVVAGVARGARTEVGSEKVLNVTRSGLLTIRFDFQPGEYTNYQAEILSLDGAIKQSVPLRAGSYESSVTLSVPLVTLGQGKYSAVLRAQSPAGSQELASDSFELKFEN